MDAPVLRAHDVEGRQIDIDAWLGKRLLVAGGVYVVSSITVDGEGWHTATEAVLTLQYGVTRESSVAGVLLKDGLARRLVVAVATIVDAVACGLVVEL